MKYLKVDPIGTEAVKKYIRKLTQNVEMKIMKALPKFAMVFSGWSVRYMHFIGVFDTFSQPRKRGVGLIFQSFSRLKDEFHLNADDHLIFLRYIATVF